MNKLQTTTFLLLQANAIATLLQQAQCSADVESWLPATDVNLENPEQACTEEDAANDWANCDCIPGRHEIVDWVFDADLRTDITDLNEQAIAQREYRDGHQIFNTPNYQVLDRHRKADMLWKQLLKVRKAKCQDWVKIWRNFQQDPNQSFKIISKIHRRDLDSENKKRGFGDEMMEDLRTDSVRVKYVHQQGIVTRAKFVPGGMAAERGYSGIFASGSDEVIVRFSDAGQRLDGVSESINPSIALKFLRDGMTSANQFGMIGFDTIPSGMWDFWQSDFRTNLPEFKNSSSRDNICVSEAVEFYDHSSVNTDECAPLSMGRWMSQVDPHVYQNGSSDLAGFDQTGARTAEAELKFPFELEFRVNREKLVSTNNSSLWYKQLVANSASIAEDDVLFDVYARAVDADGTLSDFEFIGEITQGNGAWTESLWGDERLFFAHNSLTDDIRDHANYLNTITPNKSKRKAKKAFIVEHEAEPKFNTEKYGAWPLDFLPAETEEQDVINGMEVRGCPFSFVIDQINGVFA